MRLSLSEQSRTHLQALLTPIEIEALIEVCDRLAQGHAPLWLMGYVTRIVSGQKGSEVENGQNDSEDRSEVSQH